MRVLESLASVSLTGIEQAAASLPTDVGGTPLMHSFGLSSLLTADVWIKAECVSEISSFKARGALTAVLRARAAGQLRGVVTSSTGNHGQGVAVAASRCGIDAHIFLAGNAPPVKREMVAALGARIHASSGDIDLAKDEARAFADEHGYLFIDDGDSPDVIEGAGTVGLEIAQALPAVDEIFVPMGGGSLAAGIAIAAKSLQPSARVIAVQAAGSPAMVLSFTAREPVEHAVNTIAEGLACRVPAPLALNCLLSWLDDAITVAEGQLLPAMHSMAVLGHLLVEPSGAAALAGAWHLRDTLAGKRIVLIASGANATPDHVRQAMAGPALGATT
jgi:threonine dehydratase